MKIQKKVPQEETTQLGIEETVREEVGKFLEIMIESVSRKGIGKSVV